jgi:predicted amidophosphoribosyltransferase
MVNSVSFVRQAQGGALPSYPVLAGPLQALWQGWWAGIKACFQPWRTRLALATLDAVCQHCRQQPARWLCDTCRAQWVNPVLVHHWPNLNASVYSLHPLTGKAKSRLYGAKFYQRSPWWCTALLAEGVQLLHPDDPLTVLTLPGRQRTHWMTRLADSLAMEGHYYHQVLHWARATLPQHSLTGVPHRWQNVTNAWTLPQRPDGPILLIDDITTTGASLFHAIKAIRATGYSSHIQALTLCYVPKKGESR